MHFWNKKQTSQDILSEKDIFKPFYRNDDNYVLSSSIKTNSCTILLPTIQVNYYVLIINSAAKQ